MLSTLPRLAKGIVVVDLETALQRLPPQTYIDAHAFDLSVGEVLDVAAFRDRLSGAGYVASSQVMAPGEFAVRGSIIDLYPMGSPTPYRIDLFDDEVESIRVFDPETQRSGERAQALRLLPAREFPLTADGIQNFKRRFRNRFPGDLTRMAIYRDIAEGAPPPGIEYYLPLFFDATATLFDYLPGNTIVAAETDVQGAAAQVFAEIASRLRAARARRRASDPRARRSVHAGRGARAAPRSVAPDRAVARRARSADAVPALSELRARARRRDCASMHAATNRRASSRAS